MLLYPLDGKTPRVAEGAFVAPTAVLVGDVEVEAGASVWFGAVLRGDLSHIHVSSGASVQDNVVVHTLPGGETHIGPDATVAHGTILHNCRVERGAVVGVGCVVLDDAVIGEQAMVAAGSVVRERFHVPPRHLAAGVPAEVKKELGGQALDWVQTSAAAYRELTARYLAATPGAGGRR
ncbi:MAG: gamma carbonic anhydrase family protein [Firmicutes bacterium]|nr:gamma carbonic anhydrase family protein [Bacillota bacterium]